MLLTTGPELVFDGTAITVARSHSASQRIHLDDVTGIELQEEPAGGVLIIHHKSGQTVVPLGEDDRSSAERFVATVEAERSTW